MKVFIVSQPSSGMSKCELIRQLDCIETSTSKAIQVIAVDDLYSLGSIAEVTSQGLFAELKGALVNCPVDVPERVFTSFSLGDFRDQHQTGTNDTIPIDGNLLACLLEQVQSNWCAIDFEQNTQENSIALIKKLARYCHIGRNLDGRNLVLMVPSLHVPHYARLANEAFNCLPVSPIELDRSGQTNMIFLSSTMERIILSLPLLTGPIRRLNMLLLSLYQRLVKAA